MQNQYGIFQVELSNLAIEEVAGFIPAHTLRIKFGRA
jgi:hypothetical protein